MITAAVRDALESTLIIEVQLSLTNSHNHFTVAGVLIWCYGAENGASEKFVAPSNTFQS